jgi:transcriptional regulator with XRE-family HTH domain
VKDSTPHVGALLKDWRHRRRLSQLSLACEANISTRHLSFLETGRSQPSRDVILRLAEWLNVPLRERNELLLAAGYAPAYSSKPLPDDTLKAAREAVNLILRAHEPLPALAVDRHWILVAANRAAEQLLDGAAPDLLAPPLNVLRLSLHPEGLAPRIANLREWRAHILERVRHQLEATADPVLGQLLKELSAYPCRAGASSRPAEQNPIVVPLELTLGNRTLRFLTTTTVFGTPLDVTLSELAIELFFPADKATADLLHHGMDTGND